MKQSEIMGLLLGGKPVVVGEFRRLKGEVIRWRDKKTGQQVEGANVRYSVETAEETFDVSRFLPDEDGKSAEVLVNDFLNAFDKAPPFKKGQRVLVEIQKWEQVAGVVKVRGELYPVENS